MISILLMTVAIQQQGATTPPWSDLFSDIDVLQDELFVPGYTRNFSVEDFRRSIESLSVSGRKPVEPYMRVFEGADKKTLTASDLTVIADLKIDLQSAWEQIFGGKSGTIVLNRVEAFDTALCEMALPLTLALSRHTAGTYCNYEITYFASNSRLTQFGIHTDPDLTSLHIGLGPGVKRLHTWSEDTYEGCKRRQDKSRSSDEQLIAFLQASKKVDLAVGDLYLFPADQLYHVAENIGFSVSFALAISKYNKEALHNFIFQGVTGWSYDRTRAWELDDLIKENEPGIYEFLDKQHPFTDAYLMRFLDFLLRRKSSCYFRTPALSHEQLNLDLINQHHTFERNANFMVVCLPIREQMHLYIRGNKLVLQHHPTLVSLIKWINAGTMLDINETIEKFRNKISGDIIRSFFAELTKYRLLSPRVSGQRN